MIAVVGVWVAMIIGGPRALGQWSYLPSPQPYGVRSWHSAVAGLAGPVPVLLGL